MTDITQRLMNVPTIGDCYDAAQEIERLRGLVRTLRSVIFRRDIPLLTEAAFNADTEALIKGEK